jgi:ABC-type uncharacterized transport system permease subunit
MMPVWLNCNKKTKKQTNTLNDKETFLSAKSWIFTIAILWGRILQNWEKRQKIRVIYVILVSNWLIY